MNPQWPGTLDVADGPSPGLGIQTDIPFSASLGNMDVYGRGVITGIAIPVTGQSPQNLNIALLPSQHEGDAAHRYRLLYFRGRLRFCPGNERGYR